MPPMSSYQIFHAAITNQNKKQKKGGGGKKNLSGTLGLPTPSSFCLISQLLWKSPSK